MDIKISELLILSLHLLLVSLFNIVIVLSFTYIAFMKNWWLLLIWVPFCTKDLSLKFDSDKDKEEDVRDSE